MNMPFVSPAAQSTVNVRELVTPRGVNAWLVEDYAVPLVSLEFAFSGGAAQDPTGEAGAAGPRVCRGGARPRSPVRGRGCIAGGRAFLQ